ncbi:unnamed protein product [Spirodela intermedia]|uniref:Uncharacterized protein n=1 Tax=Spirodela intermedia TaxID=51605 RepID=A0A7I8KT91_SPIIN|nr:unnamed protein product [Spirodela intermedia]
MAVDHLIAPCKLSFLSGGDAGADRLHRLFSDDLLGDANMPGTDEDAGVLRSAAVAPGTRRPPSDGARIVDPSLYRDEERMKTELILWAKAVAFDAVCSSRLPRHA